MIKAFRCKDTQALFEGQSPKRFRAFQSVAERKLSQLHAAATLEFLRSLFLVAKAVLVGQNEPIKAFWTRIFKSTGAL